MPSSVAARFGPNCACAPAAANVWQEPQPLAIQTARPSLAGAVVCAGARAGAADCSPPPDVNAAAAIAAAAQVNSPAATVAALTPARPPSARRTAAAAAGRP